MQIETPHSNQNKIRAQLSINLFGGFRQQLMLKTQLINAEKKRLLIIDNFDRSIRLDNIDTIQEVCSSGTIETNEVIGKIVTRSSSIQKQNKSVAQKMNFQMNLGKQLQFSEKFKLGTTIGQGAHAIVKKAQNLEGKKLAVKICRSGDPEIINTFIDTYRIARILNHPSILECYEIHVDEQTEQLQLVMEYCKYPSLQKVLEQWNLLSEDRVKNLMKLILEAVSHMNERGVAHRDLKPDNILVDGLCEEKIKIIDFGVSAKFMTYHSCHAQLQVKQKDMWTRTGNYLYCAPEIFEGVGYTERVDIWACGVIMYQCLFGKLPFYEDSIFSTIESILQAQLILPAVFITQLAKDLLFRLLQADPTKRLSPQEALLHPWFYTNSLKARRKSLCARSFKQLEHLEDLETTRKESQNKFSRSNTINIAPRSQIQIKIPMKTSKETTPSPTKIYSLLDMMDPQLDDDNVGMQECQSPIMKMSKLKRKIDKDIHIVRRRSQNFGTNFLQTSWAKNLKQFQEEKSSQKTIESKQAQIDQDSDFNQMNQQL